LAVAQEEGWRNIAMALTTLVDAVARIREA
jgi:hypothetical protein